LGIRTAEQIISHFSPTAEQAGAHLQGRRNSSLATGSRTPRFKAPASPGGTTCNDATSPAGSAFYRVTLNFFENFTGKK